MSKKEDDKERDHHPGSVAAEDAELTLWLNKLWARNEPPERLELFQMFGKNKAQRGELIHHEDFKPGEKLDVEQANKLANEIMAAAQNDCDVARKESSYQLAITDHNRKASPLTRRIGPLQPKRIYAMTKAGDLDEEDEDGLDAKSLTLRYTKEGMDQLRWDKQRCDRVMDGMLLLQNSLIQELRGDRAALMASQMTFFQQLQESMDRALDRETIREKEKFKLLLMKEGVRSARNLLPGLFSGGEQNGSNGNTNGNASANGGSNGAKDYGTSPERTLVGNFLHDIEEEGEAINIALFGNFEEHEGKATQVKPGIFSLKQYSILLGVRDGRLPTAALDNLMPNSGHADAITQEQIKKAADAGVTEGIGMAIFELVGLRQRAKEAVMNAATNTTTQEIRE